ncbi:MAG: glycosyltransferase [Acidobacteria bacterium]|nr:glycosyltransferase [Acidobacteriota bacterium]MYJ02906.1 glycosyltransferase [Acidobacteriota bacterium]
MASADGIILVLYFATLCGLSVYGAHRSLLVWSYLRGRRRARRQHGAHGALPRVTVQLPLYNERHVAERLIAAVARIRYPRDRFEVQVLDDSTDETRDIASRAVRAWRSRGVAIRYLHRTSRDGFKAGALREGLRTATGDLVALFDADFMPPADFLERAIVPFADPRVGMVQARWGHANRDYSLLTRVQALLLDGHFVLEHGGRYRGSCFFNFNGTAGIWRRAAIRGAGNWQADTLTEDLDLSYRAQLAGWRFVFLQDVVVPAELPVEMNAFKSQQHRWAKGSMQSCRKLLPAVLRARLPFRVKLEAALHLTANLNYLLLLALSLLVVPAIAARTGAGGDPRTLWIDAVFFASAAVSVSGFYGVSQRALGVGWRARLRDLPAAIALGLGLSVNNAVAVLEALAGRTGEFRRTPKYGLTAATSSRATRPADGRYRLVSSWQPLVELAFGVWFAVALLRAFTAGAYMVTPFIAFFLFGFLYAACASLAETWAHWRSRRRRGRTRADLQHAGARHSSHWAEEAS